MRQSEDARKAETRERRIRAAADLFGVRSVDAVSIDSGAERFGRRGFRRREVQISP
jgi:hypothetical protein